MEARNSTASVSLAYLIESENFLKKTNKDKTIKYAVVLNNHAMIYVMTGKFKESENMMKKALSIANEEIREKSPSYIRMKVNLALLYQLTKRYKEAEKINLLEKNKQARLPTVSFHTHLPINSTSAFRDSLADK